VQWQVAEFQPMKELEAAQQHATSITAVQMQDGLLWLTLQHMPDLTTGWLLRQQHTLSVQWCGFSSSGFRGKLMARHARCMQSDPWCRLLVWGIRWMGSAGWIRRMLAAAASGWGPCRQPGPLGTCRPLRVPASGTAQVNT
jgi:hypothetical protein